MPHIACSKDPTMKLHSDRDENVQVVTDYGTGWIKVDKQEQRGSLLVGARGVLQPWPCTRFEDLTAEHFAQLAELDVEVIIFGSGAKLRFVHPSWLRPLMDKRIGIETMDTHAACRTYNVLALEGRNVLAALVLE